MPATALRRIFANKETKTLQVSDRNGAPFVLPRFTKYETAPLAITIVEPDLAGGGVLRFARVDISPLSLLVSIHSALDTASPLTQQATWDKDEVDNVFSGLLPLNVAAMNSYIGSDPTKAAFLEIEWSEDTARSKIVIPIILENAVTQPGSAGPAPSVEYLTKAETFAQFQPNIMPAGRQSTWTSPNGVWQRIIGVSDNGEPIDQIVPV